VSRPFCVALTGGIGSGKSAVADLFASHGASVVDTDRIAHALAASGGAAIPALVESFGAGCLDGQGAMNRPWMAQRVFADENERRRLEAILHPMIRDEADRQIHLATGPYVVLVVPLLVESKGYGDIAERIMVVDCPEARQVERVVRRNGLSEARVRAMMAAQASRTERLSVADDVIDNSGDLNDLAARVARLHAFYRELAAARVPK
jgi:dephospho-CoA kinase